MQSVLLKGVIEPKALSLGGFSVEQLGGTEWRLIMSSETVLMEQFVLLSM